MKELKHLGVLFTQWGLDDVLQMLYWTAVMKRGLSQKVKLSMYWSIYLPTLINDHELWIVTEIVRSCIQAAEMGGDSRALLDHAKGTIVYPVWSG